MNARLRIPAEWERHEACWLAFPHLADEWPLGLSEPQQSVAALCRAIAGPGGEPVRLLVRNAEAERQARAMIGADADIAYLPAAYGDCWLRDTAPLLGRDASGELGGLRFRFNGWGGKFDMPADDTVGDWLLAHLGARGATSAVVMEGGGLESNGAGTFLTTESCALNDNRNPGLTREAFERALGEVVVTERVVWLREGLAHDHTDGHVDMVARFAAANTVLCMRPTESAPNAVVLGEVVTALRDAELSVRLLPAAPALADAQGARLPTTYCNFYVANDAVIVPTYGVAEDEEALEVIGEAFEGRQVIGLPGHDLLCGGGAFHCVTQPQPAPP